jgi:hypothetical protein
VVYGFRLNYNEPCQHTKKQKKGKSEQDRNNVNSGHPYTCLCGGAMFQDVLLGDCFQDVNLLVLRVCYMS